MLQKNRNYTYEELETIIKEAGKEACEKLDKDMEKAKKQNGNEKKDMGDLMFFMTNVIATHTMEKVLLGTDKEDN